MRFIIKRILTKAVVLTASAMIAFGLYRGNCSNDKEPLPNCNSPTITFETEDAVFSVNANTGTKDSVSAESQSNTESSQNDVSKESQTDNVSELATNTPDTDNKEGDDIIPLPVSVKNEEINSDIENAEEQITINEAPNPDDTNSITETNEPVIENELYLIDVPFISQLTGYPTGCETVSTAFSDERISIYRLNTWRIASFFSVKIPCGRVCSNVLSSFSSVTRHLNVRIHAVSSWISA